MPTEETIAQMRDRIEEQNKELTKRAEKIGELEGRVRLQDARELFRDAGYAPEQAELFASQGGDLTAEAVKSFADRYHLQPIPTAKAPETEGGEGATPPPESGSSLQSMSQAGSRAGQGGQQAAAVAKMSRDEWNKLNKENPAAARQAMRDGRVALREDNFYLKNRRGT